MEVRLRYTTAVQRALSTITVSGPGGPLQRVSAVETAEGSDEREIRVRFDAPLPSGVYTVQWTTAGPDSHPLSGSFAFTVERPEPEPTPAPVGEPIPGDPTLTATEPSPQSAGAPWDPVGILVRGLFLFSILGMLGTSLFRVAVLGPLAGDPLLAGTVQEASARTRALAWGVAGLFVVALPARLWKQSADLFGPDALTADSIGRILGTQWGGAWILQAAMAAVFLIGLVTLQRDDVRPRGWWMMLVAGLGTTLVPPLSGHAAATAAPVRAFAILNDAVHVTAAGAWMGTLGVLVIAGLGALAARDSLVPTPAGGGWSGAGGVATDGFDVSGGNQRSEAMLAPAARLVNAFSRIALLAVGALAATGLVSAWLQLGSLGALVGSGYGRTLLLKLLLVAGAACVGFYNWRVLRPGLAAEATTERIRRSATAEALVGVAILLITAALIATPLPTE
jgi:copper transport protein